MPIDSSIYANVNKPPQLDIGALINQARGGLQLQGEAAIGDIYKQATNPDGSIDAGKLGTLAPSAGVKAPEIAEQVQARQQGQQVIDRTKLDNIRQWWQTLDQQLYSHMNDPDLTHKKVLDSVHSLIGHKTSELNGGIFTPQLATQASSWLWGADGKPLAPDKIRKVLGQFHQRVQDHLQSSEYVPVGVGPDGSQLFMMRNGAIARDAAMPRGGAAAGAGGVPSAPAAPGLPSAPAAPGLPGGTGVPAQPGGAPAVPFTMPMGTEQSVKAMRDDQVRAKTFGQEMFPWQQALDAANELKAKYGKGYFAPGSKTRQDFASMVYGLSPTLANWLPGTDDAKLKEFAKADKYLTQAVQNRAGNFGVHSDQGLATTIRGSPNVSVNDLATDELIAAGMATRQAEHLQHLQASKAGGAGYSDAAAGWPARHDIRALLLDKISPEARSKLIGSIKKGTPEAEMFNRTLREAYETGLMTRPGK